MATDEGLHPASEGRIPVVLYAAASLDGYVAEPADGLAFLDDVAEAEPTYEAFYAGVSALLMGRRTYDVVRSFGGDWPYPGRPSVVVTTRALDDAPADVAVDDGRDLRALVHRLGAMVTPHVLGGGVSLWGTGSGRHGLELLEVRDLGRDTVRLRYRVRHG